MGNGLGSGGRFWSREAIGRWEGCSWSAGITVDPGRDTPERLAEYLDHFHPALIGLSGSEEEVAAAARGFGVYLQKGKEERDGGGSLVDHSSGLFLFAPGNRFEAILRMEGDPEKLAETLGDYL